MKPHSHWWVIKTPDGPYSEGECKWCGETREFANSIADCLPGGLRCKAWAQKRGGKRGGLANQNGKRRVKTYPKLIGA